MKYSALSEETMYDMHSVYSNAKHFTSYIYNALATCHTDLRMNYYQKFTYYSRTHLIKNKYKLNDLRIHATG